MSVAEIEVQEACDALLDAIDARNERVQRDVNGGGKPFRTEPDQEGAVVLTAALLDAGWTLEDAERSLENFVPWSSARQREHLAVAAAKITDPWTRLTDMTRKAAVEARRALSATAPALAAEEDAWTATDLDAIDLDAPVAFAPGSLAERVVYAEGLTTLAGEGDTLKSTLAQALALDAVRAGLHVVHVDYEQGQKLTMRKYRRLEATDEELRALAAGHFDMTQKQGALTSERLASLVGGREALVLVDSFSKAASAAGLSGVDWHAHGDLANTLNAFGVGHGCAVVLIDHQAGDTKYADGARSKFNAASAQWRVQVSAGKRPDEHKRGEVTLTRVKHGREGGLDPQARYAVGGDGPDKIVVRRLAAGDTTPLARDLAIIDYLREADEPRTLTEIAKGVGGRRQEVAHATRRLAADPAAPIVERDGRYQWVPGGAGEPSRDRDGRDG